MAVSNLIVAWTRFSYLTVFILLLECSSAPLFAGETSKRTTPLSSVSTSSPTGPTQGVKNSLLANLIDLAEFGDPEMQYLLGITYVLGLGTTQDIEGGRVWLQKAAAQGYQDIVKILQNKPQTLQSR